MTVPYSRKLWFHVQEDADKQAILRMAEMMRLTPSKLLLIYLAPNIAEWRRQLNGEKGRNDGT